MFDLIERKGFFIAVEGIEGCGKTTQLELLAEKLRSAGYEVVTTKAPGGNDLSNELRQLFLDYNDKIDPVTELGLLMTSMRHNYLTVIQPALQAGKIVISDRFTHTTRAIQVGAKKTPRHLYREAIDMYLPNIESDLSIYYRITPEESKRRVNSRKGIRTNLDNESLEFFHAMSNSYDAMFAHPELLIYEGRLAVVDAEQSIDDVHASTYTVVMDRLSRREQLVQSARTA